MRLESTLPHDNDSWDLSNLQIVASGGEANDMKTCVAAASLFKKYGASRNVITPGFGMTETCAGAIFNLACPDYDAERGYAVASLGTCMKGIEMRVMSGSSLATRGEPGDLEVRGEVVFGGYYRNLEATADAFPSQDGWFRTGDQACIDSNGNLRLIGRKKDVVNINGIKIGIADIDSVLEQALGERVTRFVVFPSRAAHTEQITIGYIPKGWPHATEEMIEIDELASQDEAVLIDDFAKTLCISIDEIGPNTRVFELGFTSMDLIRLKRRIDTRLGITLPVIILMTNPTARLLAAALQTQPCFGTVPKQSEQAMVTYDPVVTLKSSGTETPLWLVHPGVGEILVFVGLAKQLGDSCRPIYALRARGFEAGHTQFSSITEAVDIYVQAIRKRQPQGPYALAGYSYGTMLAFEVAKRLDAMADSTGTTGNSVRFLGSFNLPPHIKSRMRQLRWNMCLLHLTQFLGLISEGDVEDMEQMASFSAASKDEALEQVIRAANRDRMEELGLEVVALARWVDVAYGLQSMAVEYEPGGQVACIDVFHAIPLKQAAASREEWVVEHLSKWRDFSRTEPRMHPVGGAHYTMIGPEHVVEFAAKLKEALRSRGI
ncbi:putative secondary metabolism biosynthetic enzyme [Diaporthe eres]